jgi:transcriptional regulator with XRE-family HTH domain
VKKLEKDNKNIFARNLNNLMKNHGKSRKELSEVLGISYFTITAWTNGTKYPRMDKVEMLANYFGVSKSELIEDISSEDMPRKIKELRLSQGMTLEEVADVVGVEANKVRRWEAGNILNIQRNEIALLAKALSTTPAYLMGWHGNEKPVENNIKITEDEQTLLDLFRRVPEDKQQMLIQMIQVALGNQ